MKDNESIDKKGDLKYVVGDATNPRGEGKKLIIHVCNDIGVWGGGFVMAVSKKWPLPENIYHAEHNEGGLPLGHVIFVDVEDDISIANMIGQRNTRPDTNGRSPVRYGAIHLCLEEVAHHAKKHGMSVHAPRFGSGLAGGEWDIIEAIIQEELIDVGVDVTIYDLPVPYPKQVIVMRRKFPIGPNGEMKKVRTGKMIAQGAHASMAVLLNKMKPFDPSKIGYAGNKGNSLELSNIPESWVKWLNGSFTKVVLVVDTEEELLDLHKKAEKEYLPTSLITDNGLTEFNGVPTNTCIAIGPAMSDEIDKITGHLPLL